MKCKHENAVTKFGECTYDAGGLIVYEAEYLECLDCGAWLSSGPATDDERTAVEVRAAEIAAQGAPFTVLDGDSFGWRAHCLDVDKIEDDEWAGYLARCIVQHDTDGGRRMMMCDDCISPTRGECALHYALGCLASNLAIGAALFRAWQLGVHINGAGWWFPGRGDEAPEFDGPTALDWEEEP